MNDTPFQDFPSYVQPSSNRPKFLVIFIIVFVLIVIVLAGLYFLGGVNKQEAKKVAPVPTRAIILPSPSPASQSASVTLVPTKTKSTPTPVSKKNLERGDLKVAVLNGSGIVGAAKGTSAHLNSLGYNVITVGNADDFSYTGYTIKVKKSKSGYLDLLKKDVTANASKSAVVTGSIDDTISTEAEVIVGK